MTNDVEHLFMCLFAICMSYLMIIKIFHHLKNEAVYFLSSTVWEFFTYSEDKSFLGFVTCKYFPQLVAYPLILLVVPFFKKIYIY